MICIDDGSDDDSPNILNDYSLKDSRVKIISQENKGPGAARNNGLKHCTGKYIYFMDSDDNIIPEFLRVVYDNMANNDSEIVMFKTGNMKNNHKIDSKPYFPFDEVFANVDFNSFTFDYHSVRKYVMNAAFAPWTKFYKKELFDRYDDFTFNENLPYEDVLFHIKTMLRASEISFVPEYLYYYRIDNPKSSSFDYESHIKIFNVIDDIEAFLDEENYLNDFDEEFEYFKLEQITYHMIPPVSEKYFRLAGNYLEGIDLNENKSIHPDLKRKYQIFYDCDNAGEYEKAIKHHALVEKNNKLKKENEKLTQENSQLNKKVNELKDINDEILSSNSWKLSKPLRMFFNLFK